MSTTKKSRVNNKQVRLNIIAQEVSDCKICKKTGTGLPVPGEGNANAEIVFLGEAPGRLESETGKPFVGRSGQYLRSLVRGIGLDDLKDVFITSPVKYFPMKGHGPSLEEIRHGKIHLEKQLKTIQPGIVVLLGNTAAFSIFERKIPALKNHGAVVESDGIRYFLTLHPAAAIRFKKFRPIIESDFKRLLKFLEK